MIAPSAPGIQTLSAVVWGVQTKYDVAHIDTYQSVCGINVVTLQREEFRLMKKTSFWDAYLNILLFARWLTVKRVYIEDRRKRTEKVVAE